MLKSFCSYQGSEDICQEGCDDCIYKVELNVDEDKMSIDNGCDIDTSVMLEYLNYTDEEIEIKLCPYTLFSIHCLDCEHCNSCCASE